MGVLRTRVTTVKLDSINRTDGYFIPGKDETEIIVTDLPGARMQVEIRQHGTDDDGPTQSYIVLTLVREEAQQLIYSLADHADLDLHGGY